MRCFILYSDHLTPTGQSALANERKQAGLDLSALHAKLTDQAGDCAVETFARESAQQRVTELEAEAASAYSQLEGTRDGNRSLQELATQQCETIDWLAGEVDEQRQAVVESARALAQANALLLKAQSERDEHAKARAAAEAVADKLTARVAELEAALAAQEAATRAAQAHAATLGEQATLLEQRLIVAGQHDFVRMVMDMQEEKEEGDARLAHRRIFLEDAVQVSVFACVCECAAVVSVCVCVCAR